ncbi:hypothetical protein AEAC466_05180 [Asticcacaulis sp. AC466]|nr:hypothetical protein AEAC466_05180 [Asticcacaulis sp. AC466]
MASTYAVPRIGVLIFATVIASVGLNVNSTAVIVGAPVYQRLNQYISSGRAHGDAPSDLWGMAKP